MVLKNFFAFAATAIAMVCSINSGYAQAPQAQVLGSVTDPSGAVIQGAAVTLQNEQTGIRKSAVTNDSGGYVFTYLESGFYSVTVEQPGFETKVHSGIQVQVAEKKRVDVELQVGEVTKQVEVVGGAALLQTDSATVGFTVSRREVVDIPLNGREFSQLGALMPGVTSSGTTGSFMGRWATSLRVGGTKDKTNSFTLDGVDNSTSFFGGPGINPSVDSIQEFRLDKNLFSAEFGRAGAQFHVVTKTGTNSFHGSLWEYHRNYAVSAGDYRTHSRDNLLRHQFGGNIGGPIVRNKLFFFFNWESTRENDSIQEVGSMLTDKMRQGDFSEWPTPVIDPQTANPFPGNVIPRSRLHPIMVDMVDAMMPRPNRPGIVNNYIRRTPLRDTWNQPSVRADYNISGKDTLFYRLSYHPRDVQKNNGAGYTASIVELGFFNTGAGWTHTWSPTIISESRFGYHQERDFAYHLPHETIGGRNPTEVITVLHSKDQVDHLPGFSGRDFSAFGQTGIPYNFDSDNLEFANNLTISKGNHLLKLGFSYIHFDYLSPRGPSKYSWPNPQFQGIFSNAGPADLMLGLPSFSVGWLRHAPKLLDWDDIGIFLQDDWKISPSLTINIGLRYDLYMRASSKDNTWESFDLVRRKMILAGDSTDPRANADPFLVNAYKGNFIFGSETELPKRTLMHGDHNNFAPRIGFAWRPFKHNKTVVRGGYGVFFQRPDGWLLATYQVVPPYGGQLDVPNNTQNPHTVSNIFGGDIALPPPPPVWLDPNLRDTYLQQINFGIQQELPGEMVGEIVFQDQHSLKMERRYDINRPPPGGSGPLQPRRPFPEYLNFSSYNHEGTARYDGVDISLRKTSPHYTFQWSHTWAKNMADPESLTLLGTGAIDIYNRRQFIGPTAYVAHLNKAHFLIDLPFGTGNAVDQQGRSTGCNSGRVDAHRYRHAPQKRRTSHDLPGAETQPTSVSPSFVPIELAVENWTTRPKRSGSTPVRSWRPRLVR